MAMIYVDGKMYEVNDTDNLLKACLSLGFNIPYFCWHPAYGSVGACRQCAVKKYKNTKDINGFLVMSCMTPAIEGTSISIEDEEAKQFRKSVIEWLMTNHPHDCPVCEEGGNCHLQDMTVMVGHSSRRYRFTKRTHYNQNLGPFISHEMNRCIACYRCVHYYKNYADGQDLGVYGANNNIYFGRLEDGVLESEFSGNLVEICPTGVFTDKTHSEHYSRKWDMQFAPSVCQQCSLGCNTSPGERYGEIRRIENRYNGSVNHYFLCDRGRFGYGYVNLKDRPRQPMQRRGSDIVLLSAEQAINCAANLLSQSKKIIGIGSSRACIESNFALYELVGAENFFTDMSKKEQDCLQLALKVLREGGIYTPTLREIESYDAVLILGEDLTQTGARAALAVRQAVKGKAREMAAAKKIADWQIAAIFNIGQHAKYPLFVTNIDSTRLDDIAAWTYCAPIEDQARFGFAIAHTLDSKSPGVDLDRHLRSKVNVIAQALAGSKKPLIISGTNAGSIELIQAAANIAKALKDRGIDVGITMIARAVNSIGLGMINGGSLEEALNKLESGDADAVVVLENDLYHHLSALRVNSAFAKASLIIVIDHQQTATINKAHLVLSAASFAESDGTVINNEGRAQRFFQIYDPTYYDSNIVILESWRWLYSLCNALQNHKLDWIQLDHVINAVVKKMPRLAGIKNAAPDASFRIHGQKLAREPHCYSGRHAMRANISVHEPRQPQDMDTMFTFSMEGNNQPSAQRSHIPFAWAPGWNSLQAWNKFQAEIGGELLHGDPGVRLIEISKSSLDFFTSIPESFQPQEGIWRIVPYYHLFGSDELSQRSPIFQKRMPQLYIKLNPADSAKIGANSGENISFRYEDQIIKLPLIISERLTAGQVGLPIGMPGINLAMEGVKINNLQGIRT